MTTPTSVLGRVAWHLVGIACADEALAITGRTFNIPYLRRLPLVSGLCTGRPARGLVVLAVLGWHLGRRA